ncbi:MAG: CueP family metal-binding protein [Acholeplasma sp.]|jgi:hypothetical protein|nr:CueP family metal-binding protein [Acholeplasma sp.]
MKNILLYIGLFGLLIALIFIFKSGDELKFYEEYGLNIEDQESLINDLENKNFNQEISASISDQSIFIYHKNKEYEIMLQEDLFYVSLAPYINQTHGCYTHSLTGCQGELIDIDFLVKIYNEEDFLLEEKTINSGSDGFFGLFLQKGVTYKIIVEYEGLSTSYDINAFTDQTCFTGGQLS